MVIFINKNIIFTATNESIQKSLLGGKSHKAQVKFTRTMFNDVNINSLANVFKTKDRCFTDALCSTQSLVNRVAEYIIGGKTIGNKSLTTPFKRMLNIYSDSSFTMQGNLWKDFNGYQLT